MPRSEDGARWSLAGVAAASAGLVGAMWMVDATRRRRAARQLHRGMVELLLRAFELLDARPAVIGPARDGGYYLLGLTRLVDGIFDGIAWSTPEVLAATLARFRAAGVEPAMLETLSDVDEVEDLPEGWMDG